MDTNLEIEERLIEEKIILEKQKYMCPSKWNSFSSSKYDAPYIMNYLVKDPMTNESLANIINAAVDVGFTKTPETIKTRNGEWEILDRKNFEMPNFPDGSTTTHSKIGLYRNEDISQAVMRISKDPFDDSQFNDNLENLTKHYFERPAIFGFPSKIINNSISGMFVSFIAGGLVAGLTAYRLTGDSIATILWAMAGATGAFGGYPFLNRVLEKYAKSKLPSGELYVKDQLYKILLSDKEYLSNVAVKKELYKKLSDEGTKITPAKFIQDVYPKLWEELIERRIDEKDMKKTEFQAKYGETEEIALEGMVQVSRIILDVQPRYAKKYTFSPVQSC